MPWLYNCTLQYIRVFNYQIISTINYLFNYQIYPCALCGALRFHPGCRKRPFIVRQLAQIDRLRRPSNRSLQPGHVWASSEFAEKNTRNIDAAKLPPTPLRQICNGAGDSINFGQDDLQDDLHDADGAFYQHWGAGATAASGTREGKIDSQNRTLDTLAMMFHYKCTWLILISGTITDLIGWFDFEQFSYILLPIVPSDVFCQWNGKLYNWYFKCSKCWGNCQNIGIVRKKACLQAYKWTATLGCTSDALCHRC